MIGNYIRQHVGKVFYVALIIIFTGSAIVTGVMQPNVTIASNGTVSFTSQVALAVNMPDLPLTASISETTHAITVEPNVLTDSGWVTITYQTKLYDGPVDVVAGFTDSKVQIVKSQVWEAYPHTLYNNVDVIKQAKWIFKNDKAGDIDIPGSNSTAPDATIVQVKKIKDKTTGIKNVKDEDVKLNTYVSEVTYQITDSITNLSSESVDIIAYNQFDGKDFTYSYSDIEQQPYTSVFEDWNVSITNTEKVDMSYSDMSKWQAIKTAKNVSRNNTANKLRVWLDIPFPGLGQVNGKYCIGIKPSSLTIDQAKVSGQLWIIDPWYTSSWGYRKSITLSRASGAVTNYQMKLLVGESSGATGENVDCNSHCQTDFDDLRFTNSSNTTLDYWIESVTGATPNQLATVWIEFDSIGTGATTFYMYYGYASATAVSNGVNTFLSFDNFEWGNDEDNIDTSGGGITWTKIVAGSSTAKIDTSQKWSGTRSLRLFHDGTNGVSASFARIAATGTYSIRLMTRKDTDSAFYTRHGDGTTEATLRVASDENIYYYNGASFIDTLANATVDTWEVYEINDLNWTAKTVDLWLNDAKITNNADVSNASAGNTNKVEFNNAAGGYTWIDNVIVRNWRSTEPAWGAWGDETAPATSLSNTPSSKAFGTVNASSTYYAYGSSPSNPITNGECTFTVTNDGDLPINITITSSNFTGGTGWALTSGAPGENTVRLTAYASGTNPASGVVLTTSNQSFISALAASGTKKWDFKFETGTFTDGVAKTGTITLTATAS